LVGLSSRDALNNDRGQSDPLSSRIYAPKLCASDPRQSIKSRFGKKRQAEFIAEVSAMTELSEEEQRRILEAPPRGTWAVILVIGLAMLLGWLYFFFGLFVSHGPVY
jgi:hypothetical protein